MRRTPFVVAAMVIALVASGGPLEAAAPDDVGQPPANVRAIGTTLDRVTVTWDLAADPEVRGYLVRRDGIEVGRVDVDTRAFDDGNRKPGTEYSYTVETIGADASGSGRRSAAVRVRTPATPDTADTTAPSEPEGIEAAVLPTGEVRIDWGYSTDDTDIGAYVLMRNGRRLAVLDAGTLHYIDTRIASAGRHRYSVHALDVVGLRSESSDEVVVTVAAPVRSGRPSRAESAAASAATVEAAAAIAASPTLARYPYLTDLVSSRDGAVGYATINWATTATGTATVRWGAVASDGTCTPSTVVSASRIGFQVNSLNRHQWKAQLTLVPDTAYCYRVFLDSTDLLGGDPTPRFTTQIPPGSSKPFSFAVFGDWGAVDSVGANPHQANLMAQIAASGVRFALTTGDNAYSSGSQNNYGDLQQAGPALSAVFGPSYWTVPGRSIALFPAMGNHGFARTDTNHPHFVNWPQDRAVALSNGTYQRISYCCELGTTAASNPATYYAFSVGNARFYVLQAAWSDSNTGSASGPYEVDAAYQWRPTSPQYKWLDADLTNNPAAVKFAFVHYPLYSDQRHETSDTFLHGSSSLEGLLGRHDVQFALNGHAHIYQRNLVNDFGTYSYVTGGGGASTQSVAEDPCLAIDAYAIGWSNTNSRGNACGAASPPTAISRVFHFVKVTVDGSTVTFTPTDSLGNRFDEKTYTVGEPPPPAPDTTPPTAPGTLTATASSATTVALAWGASTDANGVAGYDITRDGVPLATVSGTATSHTDATARPSVTYTYAVRARDPAGNVSPPATATVTTPAAQSVTWVFGAQADAWTESAAPAVNHGTGTGLEGDTSPVRQSFLRFVVSGVGGQVSGAKVRLFVSDATSNAPQLRATTNAWGEQTITWATQPAAGTVLADVAAATAGTWIEYPLPAGAITGNGTYSFTFVGQSTNGIVVNAREAATNRPELVLTGSAGGGDALAPTVPAGLRVTAASTSQVSLAWSASTDETSAVTYEVWRNGAPLATTTGTTYVDTTVAGQTVSYTVRALDARANSSAFSNTVTVSPGIVTLTPVADAYVNGPTPDANFGSSTVLLADLSPAQRTYLRFAVPPGTSAPQSLTLRLWVTSGTADAPQVFAGPNGWDESTLTASNQPGPLGTALADLGSVSSGRWIEYTLPVTAIPADGPVTFVLVPQSSDGLDVSSREGVQAPQLVIRSG